MPAFTRVTMIGSSRRCEVALPSEEPIARLLPDLLDLLQEQPRPLRLVGNLGDPLDLDRSPAQHEVADGAVLRLVAAEEQPPPPEVSDVTDEVGLARGRRDDLWSPRLRWRTAAAGLGAVGALLPLVLAPRPATGLVVVLLAVAVAAGQLAGREDATGDPEAAGPVLLAAGAALGVGLGAALVAVAEPSPDLGWLLPAHTAISLTGWGVLAVAVGVGLGRLPVLAGGVVGGALTAIPMLLAPWVGGPDRALACGAIAAVATCGALPRLAASWSGLTRLDDGTAHGVLAAQAQVGASVAQTYACLSWTLAGAATAIIAPAAILLAAEDPWARGLGAAVLAILALRTRGLPLGAQRLALWAAVAGAALIAGSTRPPWLAEAAVVAAGAVVVATSWEPPAHVRARLHRAGDATELIGVLTLAPLALGVFGVYADLLGRFG